MGFFSWANLALVGGGATLAAFAIAAVVAIIQSSLRKDENELKLIPPESRASVAAMRVYAKIGAKRHIDTKKLDKNQIYGYLLKEIEERKAIAVMIFKLVIVIAILLTVVTLVWMIINGKGSASQVQVPVPADPASETHRRQPQIQEPVPSASAAVTNQVASPPAVSATETQSQQVQAPQVQIPLATANATEPPKPQYSPEIGDLRKELDEEDRRINRAFATLRFKTPESIDCQYSRKKLDSFMADKSQKSAFDDLLSITSKSDYPLIVEGAKNRKRAREVGFKSLVQDLNNYSCLIVG